MLDLDFASQVTAKLKSRFIDSMSSLLFMVILTAIAVACFYYFINQQYQKIAVPLTAVSAEYTWQEIGEVRATINNLERAWQQSAEQAKFPRLPKKMADLRRTLTLLEKSGEKEVLDQRKIQYHLDDMAIYFSNAQRILLILALVSMALMAIAVVRTWRRFRWTMDYFNALRQGQIQEDEDAARLAAASPLPPLPQISGEEGDALDLAKVIMHGVRHFKKQKADFTEKHKDHLVLPVDPLASPDGPAYLRKAMRFKTPLAVLITDPADLSPAQQVMNYSETGILIRFPHQEIGPLKQGMLVQGRLGTADRFSTFAGRVVRIETRTNGDLVGIKFVAAPW